MFNDTLISSLSKKDVYALLAEKTSWIFKNEGKPTTIQLVVKHPLPMSAVQFSHIDGWDWTPSLMTIPCSGVKVVSEESEFSSKSQIAVLIGEHRIYISAATIKRNSEFWDDKLLAIVRSWM